MSSVYLLFKRIRCPSGCVCFLVGRGGTGASAFPSLRKAAAREWGRADHALLPGQKVHTVAPYRDVVLFEHDRSGFFRLVAAFCACQLLFWTYLAHFAFSTMRGTGRGSKEDVTVFGVRSGTSRWRYGFTVGCLVVGGAIVGLGTLFSRRSVSRIILHAGGSEVTVTTQSPMGLDRARRLRVPLSQVACHAHRLESPSFIPLRVKGHRFYFLLDKEGQLNNHKLFDTTVGAYRCL